jgi:hypothetical protein
VNVTCTVIYQAVAIPHYAPIANVIQLATHHKVGEDYAGQRFKPGDVCCAGAWITVYPKGSI